MLLFQVCSWEHVYAEAGGAGFVPHLGRMEGKALRSHACRLHMLMAFEKGRCLLPGFSHG
jgi:hypothetical protein